MCWRSISSVSIDISVLISLFTCIKWLSMHVKCSCEFMRHLLVWWVCGRGGVCVCACLWVCVGTMCCMHIFRSVGSVFKSGLHMNLKPVLALDLTDQRRLTQSLKIRERLSHCGHPSLLFHGQVSRPFAIVSCSKCPKMSRVTSTPHFLPVDCVQVTILYIDFCKIESVNQSL